MDGRPNPHGRQRIGPHPETSAQTNTQTEEPRGSEPLAAGRSGAGLPAPASYQSGPIRSRLHTHARRPPAPSPAPLPAMSVHTSTSNRPSLKPSSASSRCRRTAVPSAAWSALRGRALPVYPYGRTRAHTHARVCARAHAHTHTIAHDARWGATSPAPLPSSAVGSRRTHAHRTPPGGTCSCVLPPCSDAAFMPARADAHARSAVGY